MLGAFICYMFVVWYHLGYWVAFALAIVSLVVSKYLQLSRRNGAPTQPPSRAATRSAAVLIVQAMA